MATYYVDLSQVGTGDGTPENPLNFAQFYEDPTDGDIFKLKGSIDSSTFSFYKSLIAFSIVAWDLVQYGPWRMNIGSFRFSNGTLLSGGIINCNAEVSTQIVLETASVKNMFVKGVDLWMSTITSTAQGCTFAGMFTSLQLNSLNIYDDCVFSTGSFSALSQATFNNCVFTYEEIPGTKNNCQISWVPPTWPAWDADRSAFAADILSVGINTPPESGNPPYTGYETGLWGEARTGIGAMDFSGTTRRRINDVKNIYNNISGLPA